MSNSQFDDVHSHHDSFDASQPSPPAGPHPEELPRRERNILLRGLPGRGDLLKLAEIYLNTQRRLWPRLAEAGLLPETTQECLVEMVQGFIQRVVSKTLEPFPVQSMKEWAALGTSYLRYSSAQQNPRSLDDQLVLQLVRAQSERILIPWQYVFADAGVSGSISARIGYKLAKQLLQIKGTTSVDVLFVDELSRASRDSIETLLLGHQVQTAGKRIISVSDGFDSRDDQSKLKLHFFAMFNEQFLTQHRHRVLRGKEGAARRGTVQGRLPIGLKAVPLIDSEGRTTRTKKGSIAKTYAIDEVTRPVVELVVTRFVDERRSMTSIAKEFNRNRVGGRVSWATCSIRGILNNYLYAGIVITNREEHVTDPVTGRLKIRERPRKEWTVTRARAATIWSWKRWKQIKQRLRDVNEAWTRSGAKGNFLSRNEAYPTTLLSGLLFCGHCGAELKLFRSQRRDDRRTIACLDGRYGKHGCKLRNTKAAGICEETILAYVRREVLTPACLSQLILNVNEHIVAESNRPPPDTTAVVATLTSLTQKRDRLVNVLGDGLSPDFVSIRNRIGQLEREIQQLTHERQRLEQSARRVMRPVDPDGLAALLPQMRDVLNQDIPIAAEALRTLFGGKIWIRSADETGGSKAWTASFKASPVPLLIDAAKKNGSPDTDALVSLSKHIWSQIDLVSIPIRREAGIHEKYATDVVELVSQGMTFADAARTLGIPEQPAADAYRYAQDGLTSYRRKQLAAADRDVDATAAGHHPEMDVLLPDEVWAQVAPILQAGGAVPGNERRVINAMLYSLKHQVALARLPKSVFVQPRTIGSRITAWRKLGVWPSFATSLHARLPWLSLASASHKPAFWHILVTGDSGADYPNRS
jgi:DNA invertase Pin-like site-specific DNA recombinase